MRIRLKGVNKISKALADGSRAVHYDHRATGTRLEGQPGSAEFLASFDAATKAAALNRSAGTISWLIKQYCDSRAWKKLAASTREIGKLNLKAVEDKWGKTSLKIAGDKRSCAVFLKWHDKVAEEHPRAADAQAGGPGSGAILGLR